MQSQLTTGKGLARSVTVTVPAATVDARTQARTEQLAKTAKVDGFRPGKVPASVVQKRMGEQIAQDVAQALVNEFLPQALKEHELSIAGQPSVHTAGAADTFAAKPGADFTFVADVELYPQVEPKNYTGLKLTKETAEPDEDLMKTALARLEDQLKQYAPKAKGAKAEKGDQLTISGQGYADDKPFEGGNLKDFKVVLGSGSLIPGFEDGLVGSKAGDEVDVNVTFPENYHAKELAGKPSVFKLKVEAIETPSDEPLSDASVKQLGFENLDALKDILQKGAVRDLSTATEQRLKRQLLDQLEEGNKEFDIPQSLVRSEHEALWRAQLNDLQQRGLPLSALGDNIEQAIESLKPLAERRVRLGLVLAAIAKAEKIEVKDEELNAAINAQIAAAGPQQEQARAYFAQPQNRQQLLGPVLEDKVTGWLIENAKVTEKKIPAKELLAELQ